MLSTHRVPVIILSAFASAGIAFAIDGDAHQSFKEVDPFIGVDGGGNVCVGSALPFSLVRLGPDTQPPCHTSGYVSGKPVIGFSHTHTSGTGGAGRYGNLLVTPETGDLDLHDRGSPITGEQAEPGYYRTTLTRWGVTAELTQGARFGVHRYTFEKNQPARLLIDPSSHRVSDGAEVMTCSAATITLVSDRIVEGSGMFPGGWGNNATLQVYFAAEADRPFTGSIWQGEKLVPGAHTLTSSSCGAVLEFAPSANPQIALRVGLSFSSIEHARAQLEEARQRPFDAIRNDARAQWESYLALIRIEGGTAEQRSKFYTALYHAAIMPTDVTGDAPNWPSDLPNFWDFYCIWDTFHTVNPLYTLILPKQEGRIVSCLTQIAAQRGWVPDAWITGDYASIQGGTNGDVVIADAIVKNLDGIDRRAAYAAIRRDAVDPSGDGSTRGRFLRSYLESGYLPSVTTELRDAIPCAVSRTLEYAYDDFAVSLAADATGNREDAARFRTQSLNAWHVFNQSIGFFWAKDATGHWLEGFTPTFERDSWKGPFYEGTPFQYRFSVPHDVQGLVDRLGGKEPFLAALDQLFEQNLYDQGNEPDLLAPWLYDYIGRPDRVAERVRTILTKNYRITRDGLPGNDDAGTMSAWYIFGALGFYPNAGQDIYLLGSPIFSKVTLALGEEKSFTIEAHNLSDKNIYVQSALLNGRRWDHAWFRHHDIANGAKLELVMGPSPSHWGTTNPPPSLSTDLKLPR